MSQTILIIIGAVIVALLLTRKGRKNVLRQAQDKLVGICSTALDQTVRKSANKERALAFIKERARSTSSGQGETTNAELREHLGVTDRSVVRYLDELEKEGKVEQVGNTGRSVTYRLK
jgi:predicted HTH transcriptional regulator